jgi:ATP-dependent DNA helicase RecG
MELNRPLRFVPGIGPTIATRLEKLNLSTVEDLINHYPFRYEDFSNLSSVPTLHDGEVVTLKGQIWSIANTFTRFKRVITKAVFNDGSGSIDLILV